MSGTLDLKDRTDVENIKISARCLSDEKTGNFIHFGSVHTHNKKKMLGFNASEVRVFVEIDQIREKKKN